MNFAYIAVLACTFFVCGMNGQEELVTLQTEPASVAMQSNVIAQKIKALGLMPTIIAGTGVFGLLALAEIFLIIKFFQYPSMGLSGLALSLVVLGKLFGPDDVSELNKPLFGLCIVELGMQFAPLLLGIEAGRGVKNAWDAGVDYLITSPKEIHIS